MKAIQAYLTFNGNCREAMNFYTDALDADLQIMDAEGAPGVAEEHADKVLHAKLQKGDAIFMASDNMSMPQVKFGDNFSMSIDCENTDEQDRFFEALKEGGNVTMPLQDVFWGARFGMLVDKFGVKWMFNFDYAKH